MITRLIQDPIENNTYIIDENDFVVIIDPTGDINSINNIIRDKNIDAIFLTHGHYDHIGLVDTLMNKYNCPAYIHELDKEIARNNPYKDYPGGDVCVKNKLISFESTLDIKGHKFDIYHTPGHSEGSVIIKYNNVLFTGDTLFKEGIGRTDLISSNHRDMIKSLDFIKSFDKDLLVYPGHGDTSDIEHELKYNHYLK